MKPNAMLRSVGACVLALTATLAACSQERGPSSPQFSPAASLSPGTHKVVVTVLDPDQNPVPGAVVTAANVATGEYDVEQAGPLGLADFELPDGSYLLHARNLKDPGPILPGLEQPLVLAPLPEGSPLINTSGTQGVNNLGVLYDPSAATGWVPLDPPNYSRLVVNPGLVLSGPPDTHNITLQFIRGGALDCNFLDAAGHTLTLPSTENVFIILPLTGPVPPLPSWASAYANLPRGILLGVTTAPAGATSCHSRRFQHRHRFRRDRRDQRRGPG